MKKINLIIAFYFIFYPALKASYYDVLPKGVRNLTYRFIETNKIEGSYSNSGQFSNYAINAQISADTIKGINSAVDLYLDTLSTADYDSFSFGTFEGNAKAKVKAHAFGFGYGLTNKITLYGFIPFYQASVELDLKRTQNGQKNVGSAIGLENLPDINEKIIQSLFVNYFGYQPLGKWEANQFGDTEVGAMIQLLKAKEAGILAILGAVIPTGKSDDPDILQDINLGDRQWDFFLETGAGIKYTKLDIDTWLRMTYQMKKKEDVRLPENENFPITSRKNEAQIKLGNKFLYQLQPTYNINDQWNIFSNYSFEYIEKTKFKSIYSDSDQYLAKNTEQNIHTVKMGLGYSTINYFKKNFFPLPLMLSIAGQSIVDGKNTPRYQRIDLEFRMFF